MPKHKNQLLHRVRSHDLFDASNVWLHICVTDQILFVMRDDKLIKSYAVSTAKNGVGCEQDSYKTPLGLHKIEQKIGKNCELGEVIKAREPTGCVAPTSSSQMPTDQDLITSRVLWLKGLEPHVNCGDGVDSFNRYIYIHGTHEEGLIGLPVSKGCIRMMNKDVVKLFDCVNENTLVLIDE